MSKKAFQLTVEILPKDETKYNKLSDAFMQKYNDFSISSKTPFIIGEKDTKNPNLLIYYNVPEDKKAKFIKIFHGCSLVQRVFVDNIN